MKRVQLTAVFISMLLSVNALAQAIEWTPVTGAEVLRTFMSGLEAERKLPNGEMSRGEYNADGTGTMNAWGAEIPRKWKNVFTTPARTRHADARP